MLQRGKRESRRLCHRVVGHIDVALCDSKVLESRLWPRTSVLDRRTTRKTRLPVLAVLTFDRRPRDSQLAFKIAGPVLDLSTPACAGDEGSRSGCLIGPSPKAEPHQCASLLHGHRRTRVRAVIDALASCADRFLDCKAVNPRVSIRSRGFAGKYCSLGDRFNDRGGG